MNFIDFYRFVVNRFTFLRSILRGSKGKRFILWEGGGDREMIYFMALSIFFLRSPIIELQHLIYD